MSSLADYLLPGAAPNTYVLYAIAGARIYHSTQPFGTRSGTLSFGRSQGSKDKKAGNQWAYSHLKGTLVFGRDRCSPGFEAATVDEIVASSQREGGDPSGEWWFQLVDDEAGKVLWKFKLPLDPGSKFSYELDRPFFHVFQGSVSHYACFTACYQTLTSHKSRKYGFLFDDDKESAIFSGEVHSRTTAALAATCMSLNPKGQEGDTHLQAYHSKTSKG
jgi:Wiskott-Aldrich syndrome protein